MPPLPLPLFWPPSPPLHPLLPRRQDSFIIDFQLTYALWISGERDLITKTSHKISSDRLRVRIKKQRKENNTTYGDNTADNTNRSKHQTKLGNDLKICTKSFGIWFMSSSNPYCTEWLFPKWRGITQGNYLLCFRGVGHYYPGTIRRAFLVRGQYL